MDASLNPVHSTLEDDPELREEINEFVIGLAESIDLLQDAEAIGDLAALSKLSEGLIQASERFGYMPMADIARDVSRAGLEGDPDAARKGLEEITDLGRRIRMGHRGAA